MIPGKPAEGAVPARRIEAPDVHPCFPETLPEPSGGLEKAAYPVIKHANPHTCARFLHQQIRKFKTGLVVMDDVHFQMNGMGGGFETIQPRRVILPSVNQEADVVAAQERGSRSPGKDLFCEQATR